MGHPPTEDFVAGVQCALFEATFGTTETPLVVKAVIEGMVKCPLYPNAPVNGTVYLHQAGNPCTWIGNLPGEVIQWLMIGVGSFIVEDLNFPRAWFFQANGLVDFYNNSLVCPIGGAEGGTATITWGPEIPKL